MHHLVISLRTRCSHKADIHCWNKRSNTFVLKRVHMRNLQRGSGLLHSSGEFLCRCPYAWIVCIRGCRVVMSHIIHTFNLQRGISQWTATHEEANWEEELLCTYSVLHALRAERERANRAFLEHIPDPHISPSLQLVVRDRIPKGNWRLLPITYWENCCILAELHMRLCQHLTLVMIGSAAAFAHHLCLFHV